MTSAAMPLVPSQGSDFEQTIPRIQLLLEPESAVVGDAIMFDEEISVQCEVQRNDILQSPSTQHLPGPRTQHPAPLGARITRLCHQCRNTGQNCVGARRIKLKCSEPQCSLVYCMPCLDVRFVAAPLF